MRKIIRILVLVTILGIQGIGMAAPGIQKLSPVLQYLMSQSPEQLKQDHRFGVTIQPGKEPQYSILVRSSLSREALIKMGYPVQSSISGIHTMDLTSAQILALSQNTEVRTIEGSYLRAPVLNITAWGTTTTFSGNTVLLGIDARFVHAKGITGKGVIIGDVDTGIDFTHGDFLVNSTSSRILSIWDQTDNTTGNHPAGYSYGREYSRATINAQLANPSAKIVLQKDPEAHGTHVMGIAAGNGMAIANGVPAETYKGIAPEADIIMVNTDFTDAHIIDGIRYIFSVASVLNQPAVVNLSIGGQGGPHDGTDAFESAIDAMIGPGQIVAVAAGNDGTKGYHAESRLSLNASDTISFSMSSPNRYFGIDVWYNGPDKYDCQLISPHGTNLTATTLSVATGNIGGGTGQIYNNTYTSPNTDSEIYLTVSLLTDYGVWQMVLKRNSNSTGNGYYHAWVTDQSTQFMDHTTFQFLVTEPGHVKKAITVGSYVTRSQWTGLDGTTYFSYGAVDGRISLFSGIGPSRDSTRKPELAAPGQIIASSLSSFASYTSDLVYNQPDFKHRLGQGTSFSSPHVAGAVALILQLHPNFSYDTIKTILRSQGTKSDYYTGTLPDSAYKWGYGKLNLRNIFESVSFVDEYSIFADE